MAVGFLYFYFRDPGKEITWKHFVQYYLARGLVRTSPHCLLGKEGAIQGVHSTLKELRVRLLCDGMLSNPPEHRNSSGRTVSGLLSVWVEASLIPCPGNLKKIKI